VPRDSGPCLLSPIAVQDARPEQALEIHRAEAVLEFGNVRYASLARLRRDVASTLALIEMSRMVVWLTETPYGYREAA